MKKLYELKTKNNTIRLLKSNTNDHITVLCYGKVNDSKYKKQTLIAILSKGYSKAELMTIAYHLFYLIRQGKLKDLPYVNHAEVFGSMWD